jgi:hypothetical protein
MPNCPDLGLCPDCFQTIWIKPLVQSRSNLLRTLSELDKKLAIAVDRLDRAGLSGEARLSILHRCVCGFADLSWIAVSIHIDSFGAPQEHRHEERGILREAREARSHVERQPRVAVSAASIADEDIG